MPFYEYQCANCGHHLEAMQKISEAPLKKCPECGKSQLKRLISAPVFRLKGGGWYETDFKSDKDTKRNLHGTEEAPKAADEPRGDAAKGDATKGGANTGSDTAAAGGATAKPEAKAEAKSDSAGKTGGSAAGSRGNKPKAKPVSSGGRARAPAKPVRRAAPVRKK